jgi:hypothetical protein
VDGTDRINSYFDHRYPTYTSCPNSNRNGPCPSLAYAGVLIYTGDDLPDCDYVGQPGRYCYDGHDGIDFKVSQGAAVYAAHKGLAAGEIWNCPKKMQNDPEIVIDVITVTDGPYRIAYLHLTVDSIWQDLKAHPRLVNAGDRIGTVGNSGSPRCSSNPHLHFQVNYDANHDGRFTSNEVIDPYGFNPTKADPWQNYSGVASTWLWEADPVAQLLLLPGVPASLVSGQASVNTAGDAFAQPASVALLAVPDPGASSISFQQRVQLSANPTTLGVGSTFVFTGVYTDGTQLAVLTAPFTFTFSFADDDVTAVDVSMLRIHSWDSGTSSWVPLTTTLNTVTKQAVASSNKMGMFSLRARPLNPAPVLISVSPTWASENSVTVIIVSGANFALTPSLDLGATALDVHFVSSSTLTATVPAQVAPNRYPLVLRNPDGQVVALGDAITVYTPVFLPIVAR